MNDCLISEDGTAGRYLYPETVDGSESAEGAAGRL